MLFLKAIALQHGFHQKFPHIVSNDKDLIWAAN